MEAVRLSLGEYSLAPSPRSLQLSSLVLRGVGFRESLSPPLLFIVHCHFYSVFLLRSFRSDSDVRSLEMTSANWSLKTGSHAQYFGILKLIL